MCSDAAEGDDGAEADEPEEQGGGDLLDPDERMVEAVAGDDAGEEDDHLDDDEGGGEGLAQQIDGAVEGDEGMGGGPRRRVGRWVHASGPVVPSRADQSGAPNLACQVL